MTKKFNPYVHSNFKRRDDDDYKTVDPRCTWGLIEHYKSTNVLDVCAPSGSGIVDTFIDAGYKADGIGDAFTTILTADMLAFNPPYKRPLVDEIIYHQIDRLQTGQAVAVAALLRSNFAFAKSRQKMFRYNKFYAAEIKLLFRPKWLTAEEEQERIAAGEKIHGPVHNFVWHIWHRDHNGAPIQLYSEGNEPE